MDRDCCSPLKANVPTATIPQGIGHCLGSLSDMHSELCYIGIKFSGSHFPIQIALCPTWSSIVCYLIRLLACLGSYQTRVLPAGLRLTALETICKGSCSCSFTVF
ncbi:6-phosphofructokinase type C [Platysternon megacephalum]|uniref:6-phosphofructokinase type C n=1 Tax=Platysternon megacephalum TaxID=55544 RepID=A0A4D9ESX8_9SAUR|nr:6-phosphofructokinase type C [Platysternon megacephalum]